MRPAYNIARFFAKPIRSHPTSKGTAQSSIVPLRPNWSIDHPPTGPPNMAPTVTRDCKENEIGNKVVRLVLCTVPIVWTLSELHTNVNVKPLYGKHF